MILTRILIKPSNVEPCILTMHINRTQIYIYINIFQHKEEKKPKDGCDYNDIETTTHTHS